MKPYREARILRQRLRIFMLSFPQLFIFVAMLTISVWGNGGWPERVTAFFSGAGYLYILALAFLSKPNDLGE